MNVVKRNGTQEKVKFDKIAARIEKQCYGLNTEFVDPFKVATKVIQGITDGITTRQLDELASRNSAALISTHPDYSVIAARLSITALHKETSKNFSTTIENLYKYIDPITGQNASLIDEEVYKIIKKNAKTLNSAIDYNRDLSIDYVGFKTLERSYLLKTEGQVTERPQHMWMRVAIGIHKEDIEKAIETYDLMSQGYFTHATPTLFNAGTPKPQMSSCFLLGIKDSLGSENSNTEEMGIANAWLECAMISKSAGGIGVWAHDIRAKGSYIKGTGGISNGLVPMLKVFNQIARYVDQGGGKRMGSFAVYLEPWHADVEDFLDLKKGHGSEDMRARDLFYAMWTPDLFMERVEQNGDWTLFDPAEAPNLSDVYGEKFEKLYTKYEKEGRGRKTMKARDLFHKMMESQIETGTPYMLYKDAANEKSNQKNLGTIKSSNLCMTEDQRVVTSEGYLTVKELFESDKELKLFSGHHTVGASKMKLRGKQEDVYKVILKNGLELTVTPEHGIPVIDSRNKTKYIKRIEVKNLKAGDKVAIQTEKGLFGNLNMKDEAYLLGLYQSDGTQNKSSIMFDLWEQDFDLVDIVEEKVAQLYEDYNYIPRYSTKGGVFIDSQVSQGDVKKKRLTTDFFKKFGFEKGSIPQWMWKSTEETQWEYVKGLLQADGTVHISDSTGNPVQLSYADINRSFLQELQLLFNNLGLQSSIFLLRDGGKNLLPNGKGGQKEYNCKPCYRLVVGSKNNVLEIEEKTGFLSRKNVIIEDRKYRDNTKKGSKVASIEYVGKKDVYCPTVYNDENIFIAQGMRTFNCTEIMQYTDPHKEISVCNLASLALPKYLKQTNRAKNPLNKIYEFDYTELHRVTKIVTRNLNKVIDENYYPIEAAKTSNMRHRPIALGVQGLADVFAKLYIPFDSEEAKEVNKKIFETIYHAAVESSMEVAKEEGAYETFKGSPMSEGIFQFDMWDESVKTSNGWEHSPIKLSEELNYDWDSLKEEVKTHGVRNSLLVAPMPTASTSQILGNNECFEPYTANVYKRNLISGEFIIMNRHLIERLVAMGMWSDEIKQIIIAASGSIQNIEGLPQDLKDVFKTVWEIKQKHVLDMAADRGAFIDQSQSMNIFMEGANFKKLSSAHMYAWKKGLKTGMYYLRTQAASNAIQFTIDKKYRKTTQEEPAKVQISENVSSFIKTREVDIVNEINVDEVQEKSNELILENSTSNLMEQKVYGLDEKLPERPSDSQFECIGCGS